MLCVLLCDIVMLYVLMKPFQHSNTLRSSWYWAGYSCKSMLFVFLTPQLTQYIINQVSGRVYTVSSLSSFKKWAQSYCSSLLHLPMFAALLCTNIVLSCIFVVDIFNKGYSSDLSKSRYFYHNKTACTLTSTTFPNGVQAWENEVAVLIY